MVRESHIPGDKKVKDVNFWRDLKASGGAGKRITAGAHLGPVLPTGIERSWYLRFP